MEFCKQVCKNQYYEYRAEYRHKTTINKYKNVLIDYGILGLSYDNNGDNNVQAYLDHSNPLSSQQLNLRVRQMVNLVVAQDASLGIIQNFLKTLMKRVTKKYDLIHDDLKTYFTPLIVRDINTMLKNFRNDPMRMTYEAFNYRAQNISYRKAQSCRNSVLFYYHGNTKHQNKHQNTV